MGRERGKGVIWVSLLSFTKLIVALVLLVVHFCFCMFEKRRQLMVSVMEAAAIGGGSEVGGEGFRHQF